MFWIGHLRGARSELARWAVSVIFEKNYLSSEGSEQTKHWRGKPLFTNDALPFLCFVSTEPADAPGYVYVFPQLPYEYSVTFMQCSLVCSGRR